MSWLSISSVVMTVQVVSVPSLLPLLFLGFASESGCKWYSQLTPLQKTDWIAAQILHTNVSAALAGDPTAAFYGSNNSTP